MVKRCWRDLFVASITEAWIETRRVADAIRIERVASITEAWIETKASVREQPSNQVASITEAWIETDCA